MKQCSCYKLIQWFVILSAASTSNGVTVTKAFLLEKNTACCSYLLLGQTVLYSVCCQYVCTNTTFNSAMLMLTKCQKCIFLSAIMIFTETAKIRMTVRFWTSLPDGPDAIYIFTIIAEIMGN